ncbi:MULTISPECIES: hypothetical protein [Sphingobacterium]|uniref:hypothetical protein n=1 Tax=Sphingobacterium TaxID=28453 RepID=UPI000DB5ADFD|nr:MULTISPECIES: hypothetical protein [Sphingobacterium]PZU13935.1 MAG: hypothetical protein DI622_13760 [Chryseobacterium sp.]
MNINYRVDSELSEDQIEADVSSYLGYITPFWSKRFKLISVDEQATGADKLFNRFIPLYLQFKVSEGLKPLNSGFNLKSPSRPLQKIRSFRRTNNINNDPILYFRLRDKAKNAFDFQHNILKSLNQPPRQFGFYVAPLTLKIEEYDKSLEASMLEKIFGVHPFLYREEIINTDSFRHRFGMIPFLRGHVSIPPHETVSTSEHYYSFSKAGTNIAWHSGEKLYGDFRLSSQIESIFKLIYYSSDFSFNRETYINFIEDFFKKFNLQSTNLRSFDNPILEFAHNLKTEYNIKLLLISFNK